MANTKQNKWVARRRLIILRLLDADRDRAALSAESLVVTLRSMRVRKHKEMRGAPPLTQCGFNINALRRDFTFLENECFVDIRFVKHAVGGRSPSKFKVAHITTAGRQRARGKVFTF